MNFEREEVQHVRIRLQNENKEKLIKDHVKNEAVSSMLLDRIQQKSAERPPLTLIKKQ